MGDVSPSSFSPFFLRGFLSARRMEEEEEGLKAEARHSLFFRFFFFRVTPKVERPQRKISPFSLPSCNFSSLRRLRTRSESGGHSFFFFFLLLSLFPAGKNKNIGKNRLSFHAFFPSPPPHSCTGQMSTLYGLFPPFFFFPSFSATPGPGHRITRHQARPFPLL